MAETKKTPAPAKKAAKPASKKKAACSATPCKKDAVAKGMCNAHYTAERRKDPAVREKAREASRKTYAKRKAGKETLLAATLKRVGRCSVCSEELPLTKGLKLVKHGTVGGDKPSTVCEGSGKDAA